VGSKLAFHFDRREPTYSSTGWRSRARAEPTRSAYTGWMSSIDALRSGAAVGADPSLASTSNGPTASAGFGSPGTDATVKRIDLNDALIRHPQSTFARRATGIHMRDAGSDVLALFAAGARSCWLAAPQTTRHLSRGIVVSSRMPPPAQGAKTSHSTACLHNSSCRCHWARRRLEDKSCSMRRSAPRNKRALNSVNYFTRESPDKSS